MTEQIQPPDPSPETARKLSAESGGTLPNLDELAAWRNKVHQVDASLRSLREPPVETRHAPRIGWTRPRQSSKRLARAFKMPSGPTTLTPETFTSSAA